jgi:hypothetical protein
VSVTSALCHALGRSRHGDAFRPPETDPHKFELIKRLEIGICASILKNVRRFQFLVNEGKLGTKTADEFLRSNYEGSFLSDQPTRKQIESAASEAGRKRRSWPCGSRGEPHGTPSGGR